MNILTRRAFGVPDDPWAEDLDTADSIRMQMLVRAAARGGLMVSIAGPRGAGKTRAVRGALRALGAQLVEPLRLDRERLHLGDIQDAIVSQLSDERPRRSGEARSGQTRRVLGAAAARGSVLLWIDDAHVLHPATVRGLKRLRELSWRGRAPLLGVVLTGQTDRTAGIPEVGLRSERYQCEGLAADEARAAVERALAGAAERGAVEALAAAPAARNWLDLGALLDRCLAEATARGEERVGVEAVAAVLGGPGGGRAAATPDTAPVPPSDEAIEAHLRRKAA